MTGGRAGNMRKYTRYQDMSGLGWHWQIGCGHSVDTGQSVKEIKIFNNNLGMHFCPLELLFGRKICINHHQFYANRKVMANVYISKCPKP